MDIFLLRKLSRVIEHYAKTFQFQLKVFVHEKKLFTFSTKREKLPGMVLVLTSSPHCMNIADFIIMHPQ